MVKDEIEILFKCREYGENNVIKIIESFEYREDTENHLTCIVMELAENSLKNHLLPLI